MRLVRQISKQGMKIQAGGEHMGCSKVGENPENQVICLQCQDEVVRVCPGSPRSPRRAIATRLSSGSAGKGIPVLHVGLESSARGDAYSNATSHIVWLILCFPQFMSPLRMGCSKYLGRLETN